MCSRMFITKNKLLKKYFNHQSLSKCSVFFKVIIILFWRMESQGLEKLTLYLVVMKEIRKVFVVWLLITCSRKRNNLKRMAKWRLISDLVLSKFTTKMSEIFWIHKGKCWISLRIQKGTPRLLMRSRFKSITKTKFMILLTLDLPKEVLALQWPISTLQDHMRFYKWTSKYWLKKQGSIQKCSLLTWQVRKKFRLWILPKKCNKEPISTNHC